MSSSTELLDRWPEMDEVGGLSWKFQEACWYAGLPLGVGERVGTFRAELGWGGGEVPGSEVVASWHMTALMRGRILWSWGQLVTQWLSPLG